MPDRPLRYCQGSPFCPNFAGRCPQHSNPPAKHRWPANPARIRGRKNQRLRAELFAVEPFCRECRKQGRKTIATIRDHIVPLAEGGTEDPANIAPLCGDCSDRKTARESRRGRARGGL